jgi:hypothetical protein
MQGLDNLGSTCAINSLIQIICRTDNLRNIILNSNIEENTLTNHLKEILDIMYNQNKQWLSIPKLINVNDALNENKPVARNNNAVIHDNNKDDEDDGRFVVVFIKHYM